MPTVKPIFVDSAIDIPEPKLKQLFELWRAKRDGLSLPYRADFDAFNLRPWLGILHILEPIEGSEDFRYRLFGSTIAWSSGRDYTGKRASSVSAEEGPQPVSLKAAYLERRPALARRDHVIAAQRFDACELIIPLTHDGHSVSHLLVGSCFNPPLPNGRL